MGMDEEEFTVSLRDQEMVRLETENRIRNLAWTISGDYTWKVQPDVALYQRSHARGLYDAICEGAFFRCFDREEFSLYLMKKLYYQADSQALARVTRLCMDAASWSWIAADRKGIAGIRREAAEDFLEQEFVRCAMSRLGKLELIYHSRIIGSSVSVDAELGEILERMERLPDAIGNPEGHNSSYPVIALVDSIYNRLVDPQFEVRHGDLTHVLGLTLEELAEADFDWKDFLREDAMAETGAESEAAGNRESGDKQKRARSEQLYELDAEMQKKTYSYMELNYGRSYMKKLDQKRINYAVCRGIHGECSLYFTDGILHNMVRKNYQSEVVRQQYSYNLTTYRRNRYMAARNIQLLSETMRQALIRRTELEQVRSDTGEIQVRELWKLGRTGDNRLFKKNILHHASDFVVDILMDGSGSQHDRRGEVAVQAFIISEALSIVGIPHRVQSFCTCWDYTILQRFREYDAPRENNQNIFEFSTSASNRDGLAIKAVVHTLLQRQEENKILIVLSDGRPNDRVVRRNGVRTPAVYIGDAAVDDTAAEVRRARYHGIAVLGVFAGEEEDLGAEKRIFGRDFAYIRRIDNFSHVVGRYLRRQLDSGE